ncbi:PIN domain-containing protein [Luteipulveratus halotolerans]|uniref:hypothetical protein n=1 Tax=Luteipulveratus halotolerans TaxID=1631356 RepID=UPI000681F292|nr:hypothetical protein [Luteipulveratus halotolerans]
MRRKSRQDKHRFGAVEATWNRVVSAGRLTILSDDQTPELATAVQRLSFMPISERLRRQKDLGELLVIAHAAVKAEAGHDVAVLIQEKDGTAMAHHEAGRLTRIMGAGRLRVWDTTTILRRAARSDSLPDRTAMKAVYEQMRGLDLALPPIAETGLLDDRLWKSGNKTP